MGHTIEEALTRFELIAGSGSETANQACVMTALAWVAGEAWTDHPQCAHPLLASVAIRANDDVNTTPEQRSELVRAGEHGLLDTWWVPTTVIVHAIAAAPNGGSVTVIERAMAIAATVAAWKKSGKPRVDLTGADLTGADLTGADLTRADLTGADLTGADLTGAYLTGANLTGANLTGANLTRADLTRADLTGAYLTGAYLTGAYLTGAFGDATTRLPVGWAFDPAGRIVAQA